MNPFQDHRRSRNALLLAILGLCFLNGARSIARGGESEVKYSLTAALDSEAFQDLPLESPPLLDEQSLVNDTAVSLASYTNYMGNGGHQSGAVRVGYDGGFVIADSRQSSLNANDSPYLLRINGWGQLRHAALDSQGPNRDTNQFQLVRGRIIFSGHTFTSDFAYYVQLDGRSSSGDDVRLLDYFLTYDVGHHIWEWDKGTLVYKTGKYKMPFTMARYLTGREFEFTDRSMASTFFDVNRSLAWGLGGAQEDGNVPWDWEVAIFNGLVTGGAETGSSGGLDDNFAYSGRIFFYPFGEWGPGELADFECHKEMAVRTGMAFANSTIDASGTTEFSSLRVVDSGATLASLLPGSVTQYTVDLYSVDTSLKWRGWSTTFEYYFRYVDQFNNPAVDNLYDHGFWFQLGKFVVPRKLQLLTRWSRVVGDSGTLGLNNQSSEEIAGGMAWYFRDQNSKWTVDITYLDGSPINSSALDISPGDAGWLFRSQVQFAF
ncbi:hypothetical protein [Adhaeretor mobilis]|uniref:Phosphate-selective porin O and P n=1 Tax=Adhaeretor mobilis TaxID=1930276 RepID=A0A517N0D4_9BACT|nr:hypothetical protein [Adhaeretor mobilis]QDT00587.1 hypothetical protein HG15A2_39260 [Adhaeretor mobilis]